MHDTGPAGEARVGGGSIAAAAQPHRLMVEFHVNWCFRGRPALSNASSRPRASTAEAGPSGGWGVRGPAGSVQRLPQRPSPRAGGSRRALPRRCGRGRAPPAFSALRMLVSPARTKRQYGGTWRSRVSICCRRAAAPSAKGSRWQPAGACVSHRSGCWTSPRHRESRGSLASLLACKVQAALAAAHVGPALVGQGQRHLRDCRRARGPTLNSVQAAGRPDVGAVAVALG